MNLFDCAVAMQYTTFGFGLSTGYVLGFLAGLLSVRVRLAQRRDRRYPLLKVRDRLVGEQTMDVASHPTPLRQAAAISKSLASSAARRTARFASSK